MKTHIRQIVIFMMVLAAFTSSCKKEDNHKSDDNSTNISQIIITGSWRINYYHENNSDHTSNFSGYTFVFNSNGTMTATNSAGITNGTWKIDDDGSNEFHMTIGNSAPLADINNGWMIISQTSSEIHMRDNDITHNEELHFVKI